MDCSLPRGLKSRRVDCPPAIGCQANNALRVPERLSTCPVNCPCASSFRGGPHPFGRSKQKIANGKPISTKLMIFEMGRNCVFINIVSELGQAPSYPSTFCGCLEMVVNTSNVNVSSRSWNMRWLSDSSSFSRVIRRRCTLQNNTAAWISSQKRDPTSHFPALTNFSKSKNRSKRREEKGEHETDSTVNSPNPSPYSSPAAHSLHPTSRPTARSPSLRLDLASSPYCHVRWAPPSSTAHAIATGPYGRSTRQSHPYYHGVCVSLPKAVDEIAAAAAAADVAGCAGKGGGMRRRKIDCAAIG